MHAKLFICGLLIPTLAGGLLMPISSASAREDALILYSAGLEGLFADPKDQGVVRALRLVDDRLSEIPLELNQPMVPSSVIQLVLDLLAQPMSLRAGMVEGADPAAGPPIYAQINFLMKDAQEASAFSGRFAGLLAAFAPFPSFPVPQKPGMNMIDIDGTLLYHGASRAGDQSTFTIALSKIDEAALDFGATGLPAGIKPSLAFRFDAKAIQPLLGMMMAQAGPQADMVRQQFELAGLYGPDASAITAACGFGADREHFALRYTNYRKVLEKMNALVERGLSAEDLRRVPADATYAQVTKFNINAFGEFLNMMAAAAAADMAENLPDVPVEEFDPMAMIEAQVGIHPQRDFFDHLGQTLGIYMSDTTGGGGLLSLVSFMEVTNPEALGQTMTKMQATINAIAQQNARGYVRFSDRTINGQKITVLTFPGLPIPLEVSCAIANGYLYGALSPQAVLAAIEQGKVGARRSSLLDNPRFREMGGTAYEGALQAEFIDIPRVLHGGYGLVGLGAAALANAVRSPIDPERDPGLIMPSLAELSKDAKAYVFIARINGDDLVATGQCDRSVLVNACGMIGVLGGSSGAVGAGALAAGLLLPAIAKARHSAQHEGEVQEAFPDEAPFGFADDILQPYLRRYATLPPFARMVMFVADSSTETTNHGVEARPAN